MDSADAERAIYTRFAERWAETPVSAANDGYQPPTATTEWVRITVAEGLSAAAGIGRAVVGGPGAVRHSGNIIVQVFTRLNTGTTRAKELAALVTNIFQNERFDDVRCLETSIINAGEQDGWWQVNAITYFDFDERKPA